MWELGYLSWLAMQLRNKYLNKWLLYTNLSKIYVSLPPLRVHVHCQVLEDVHVAAVGDGADAGTGTLSSDELDGLGAHVPINKIVGK